MTIFDVVNFEFLKLSTIFRKPWSWRMSTLLFFLNIVQEAILIKNLKSKFSKRYKIVNFTILIIAAHLTFQKLEQRNYLVSYFFVWCDWHITLEFRGRQIGSFLLIHARWFIEFWVCLTCNFHDAISLKTRHFDFVLGRELLSQC